MGDIISATVSTAAKDVYTLEIEVTGDASDTTISALLGAGLKNESFETMYEISGSKTSITSIVHSLNENGLINDVQHKNCLSAMNTLQLPSMVKSASGGAIGRIPPFEEDKMPRPTASTAVPEGYSPKNKGSRVRHHTRAASTSLGNLFAPPGNDLGK